MQNTLIDKANKIREVLGAETIPPITPAPKDIQVKEAKDKYYDPNDWRNKYKK